MEFIISFLSEWGYLALFICMALENMNIPIPSEIILGFAGFLVSQGIFSFWPTILIGTLAGLIGSLASYYMGYKGGRDMILRHTQKGGMGAKKMIAAKNWFETYGGIAVFTGRSGDPYLHFPACGHRTISPPGIHDPDHHRHYPLDYIPGLHGCHAGRKLAFSPLLQAGDRSCLHRHLRHHRGGFPFLSET